MLSNAAKKKIKDLSRETESAQILEENRVKMSTSNSSIDNIIPIVKNKEPN